MGCEPQIKAEGDLLEVLAQQRMFNIFDLKSEMLRFTTPDNRFVRVDLFRSRGRIPFHPLAMRVRFTEHTRHRVYDYSFKIHLLDRRAYVSLTHDDLSETELLSDLSTLRAQLKPYFSGVRNLHRLMQASALLVVQWHDKQVGHGR